METNLTLLPWSLFDRILDMIESGKGNLLAKLETIREIHLAANTLELCIKPPILGRFDKLQIHYGIMEDKKNRYYLTLYSFCPLGACQIPNGIKELLGMGTCCDDDVIEAIKKGKVLYCNDVFDISMKCNESNYIEIKINNYQKDRPFN